MGKLRIVDLNAEERAALESGYRNGVTASFRERCQVILLKSSGRTSQDIGLITDMWNVSVNNWVNRYEQHGIAGLYTKKGQGRKPILDVQKDKDCVCNAVKKERQRLSQAKGIIEQELGKTFSGKTLKRFLKSLGAGTSGSERGLKASVTKSYTR